MTTLLAAAVDKRFDLDTVADVECTHAFRRIKLVSGKCEQIYAECLDIDGDLACRLRDISV